MAGYGVRRRSVYEAYQKELQIPDIDDKELKQLLMQDCNNDIRVLVDKFAFFTRYCFSCLTDADSIDTGTFCGTRTKSRSAYGFCKVFAETGRENKFVCMQDGSAEGEKRAAGAGLCKSRRIV